MGGNDFGLGYAMGADSASGGGNGGGWGMDGLGLIWILLIFAMFGGGWGFGGMGGMGGAGFQGMATRADINEGFALNNITSGITAVQQGIADSTYALNNAISGGFHDQTVATLNGFNGVERGFCNLGQQISNCCCENRAAIQDLKYTMATQACDTRNLIQTTTRDIIDGQNANTRAILDFLTQDKIQTLQAENQSLKFAASQANQNSVLMAAMDANKAELLRRTGHDCPTAAYIVQPPTPVNFPVNGCGQVQWGNWGNGCGCAA